MLLHFLENTFCQPTLGSRLVERNDYSEMLLNSSRASKAAFLCNLCGWQRAVCCRWQDDRPRPAQRRLDDSKFWQSYKCSWQGVLTNSYNFALSALANPYNFNNGFDFKIFRKISRKTATECNIQLPGIFICLPGEMILSVLTWKIF